MGEIYYYILVVGRAIWVIWGVGGIYDIYETYYDGIATGL